MDLDRFSALLNTFSFFFQGGTMQLSVKIAQAFSLMLLWLNGIFNSLSNDAKMGIEKLRKKQHHVKSSKTIKLEIPIYLHSALKAEQKDIPKETLKIYGFNNEALACNELSSKTKKIGRLVPAAALYTVSVHNAKETDEKQTQEKSDCLEKTIRKSEVSVILKTAISEIVVVNTNNIPVLKNTESLQEVEVKYS
ncbi:hypothetical protein HUJ04_002908 [Dendroctonus ponderosae]|nr:hypothetical protein HUJ04_002908 [Dendroctonus ponderosae]